MELGGWLRSLGLGQYEAAFRANEIDETVLPSLTADDLKELGVVALGHRRKLLDAIAALRAGESGKARPPDALPATDKTVRDAAERRQVTVMFSDLVGSTALSARMDPEDLREVISAYQKCVAETVRRFDGFVAKYMGDGVLVYFGYPRAHEHDAERAVRAGLELIAAVAGLKTRAPLQTRVGIATGLVVVGDLIGSGEAQERGIVGETPNLAARLQGIAEPNMVVIAESTRKLLGNLFELEDLGAKELKGITGLVRAWAALQASSVESRFEALRAAGLTALVGREEESELLLRRWSRAKSGEGQVVLLSGEPGIGKSRLTAEVLERLASEPHTRLRYFCSPQHTDSALYPIIGQMKRAAGLAHDDTPQAMLDKIDAVLAQTSTSIQDAALFAEMLSLPNDGRYPVLELTPELRRQRTLEALTSQLTGLARQRPVLMIVEDAHWIDPTSLEVFGRTMDRIKTLPVLLIVTFRPEFDAPWAGRSHVTGLALNRLGERETAAIIARLVGNKELPADVMADIVERTDGIPLFVEEMTKAVLEAEGEGEARRTAAAVPSPALAVPASLHASLMARLDRLGSAKQVAQIGAAIGREFSHSLLAAVVGKSEVELHAGLDRLVAAGLLFRLGVPPDASYRFKHALIQDAAYSSLLRARRQQLHARIAQVLEDNYPEVANRQPELVAHHYDAAGLEDRAKDYWSRAGRQALANSAFAEAINHLARALALTAKAPPSEARVREETALILDRCIATGALRGPASAEHAQIAHEALKVSAPLGDDPLHFRARWTYWWRDSLAGNLLPASHSADLLVAMASRMNADDLRLQAYHARWTTAFLRGQMAIARDDVEHGLALYDVKQHKEHWSMYGAHDPGVCARGNGSCVLWQAGMPERAAKLAVDAIHLSNELGHPYSRGVAGYHAGFFAVMVGDVDAADTYAEGTASVAAESNMALIANLARFIGGWVTMRQGNVGRGADQMEAVFRKLQEAKQRAYLSFLGTLIANAKLETGRIEDTLNFLDELQQLSVETHQQMFVPDLHRLRAEALQRLDTGGRQIEEEYQTAIQLARQQGALALELWAVMGLANWLAQTGRNKEGCKLLRPVFEQFNEGFATPDLRAAKTLLDAIV